MTTLMSAPAPAAETRRLLRDSLIVSVGGQLERLLGTLTAFALRWGLDPARLGVYSGLRISLDQTNRSSLGIGLGAVQEIPILRAAGRHDEARRITNVAFTANTITCSFYAIILLIWAALRAPYRASDPLAAEWTWGLAAIAALTLLQRRLSFHVAVLRAHQEFALTTELDIVESLMSAALIAVGLWLLGFWGLLAAVGLLLAFKIAYLNARNSLRFAWEWDRRIIIRLMWTGLPIFVNTAVFGAILNLDRVLILWLVPEGAKAAGLYSIAIMGTSWSLDLAGRIVTVLYPHFQATLGRTGDTLAVARSALAATEAQLPLLAAGSAVACVVGPAFLGLMMPRYAEGLPALRPLLPAMLLLSLTWPARQMLIAVGRPYRLCAATLAGLAVCLLAAAVGAGRFGIVGVAWGMSIGAAAVYLLTSATAFVPRLGWQTWLRHQARLIAVLGGFGLGIAATLAVIPAQATPLWTTVVGSTWVSVWLVPTLCFWAWRRRGALNS